MNTLSSVFNRRTISTATFALLSALACGASAKAGLVENPAFLLGTAMMAISAAGFTNKWMELATEKPIWKPRSSLFYGI